MWHNKKAASNGRLGVIKASQQLATTRLFLCWDKTFDLSTFTG